MKTFETTRGEFWKALSAGDTVDCPCCGRPAKVWPRTILATMARVLIRLYRAHVAEPGKWVHVDNGIYGKGTSGDYAKLRHWNLAEPANVRSFENASGHWRITEQGSAFVLGHITVAKYALVYANKCQSHAGPLVTIQQCLGKKFDYDQLMKGEQP